MYEFKQFFGPLTWKTIFLIAAVHLLAFFGRNSVLEWPLIIFLAVLVILVTWRSLALGLSWAWVELFTGGHGHLLDVELLGFSVSIRMVIFAAVMLVWVIGWATRKWRPTFLWSRDLPWAILALAVMLGFFIGISGNGFSTTFDDMNGYLTLLYLLPVISVPWDNNLRRDLLQIFAGCVVWIAGLSVLLAFLFTHLGGDTLHVLYTFVRDSRLAEITLQVVDNKGEFLELYLNKFGLMPAGNYWYRIFMPSQLILVFAVLLLSALALFSWRGSRLAPWIWAGFIFTLTGILLSMSRSFLLGLAVASVFIFITAWTVGKKRLVNIPKRTLGLIFCGLISISFIWLIVNLPIPTRPDLTEASFFATSAQTGRVQAVTSRFNLLSPMMEQIWEHPWLGSGFGTVITYTTDDPRLRAQDATGEYTTYRLEWGYHDIWLKMGALGLSAFILYVLCIGLAYRRTLQTRASTWLAAGLSAGLIALFITHIFSPFLNHPLGLGLMLFILPFLDFGQNRKNVTLEIPIFIKDPLAGRGAVAVSTIARRQSRQSHG